LGVYLAYTFHYDSTADYLGQITRMLENIDSLRNIDPFSGEPCTRFPLCLDNDCVWPGDFNRDGLVDHRDLLHWGTTTGKSGPRRNGQISWRGHLAEDWTKTLDDGTNAKHQDADGNGTIDELDLELNLSHFLNKTQGYISNDRYPGGPELVILSDPMDSQGNIGNIRVMSRRPLKDMYGIAFELEFDTFYYEYTTLVHQLPLDSFGLAFIADEDSLFYGFYKGEYTGDTRYSFVSTAHENFNIQDSFYFLRIPFGLKQKHQLPLQYLPDQFVFRLKNLVAINKDGDDLDFGAVPYIVYNPFTTAVDQLELKEIKVFPNPASDFVYVETEQTTEAQIYTIQGNLIRHLTFDEVLKPIDVSNMPPGIYILRILATGESIKIVVQ
jgi:Secretion system C-terminal sorting domain